MENAKDKWNSLDAPGRHDLLLSAGIRNVTFKYLDWEDLPNSVRELLYSANA